MENKVIKLFTDGEVQNQDRKFTRLVGGFGDNKPILTTKQISELMGYDNSIVTRTINRNIEYFTQDIDIVDLKSAMPEWQNEIGYTKNAYNASKNIYVLSQSGFLLYLKFAEGDKAVELYKGFLEDYFKTKAENIVMKKSIDEEIEFLKEQKANTLGKMFMEQNNSKKMELFNDSEKINNRITELEKTKSEQETIKKYEAELTIVNNLLNSNNAYDVGKFSKILAIPHLGRNNFFEWMRDKGILMDNNTPYQRYSEYFKIIPISNNKFADSKTLLKSSGIKYIINNLIKDGKVITKSVDEILSELEPEKIA